MTTIPAGVLQRFEQLKSFATIAMATGDGLRPEVEHWRDQITRISIGLSDLRHNHGEVTVGENGEAYLSKMRKIARGNAGHRIESYEPVHERRPDLDPWTVPLANAQKRLESAREQQAMAGERAGQLRRAVEEARRALQERGWRGDL